MRKRKKNKRKNQNNREMSLGQSETFLWVGVYVRTKMLWCTYWGNARYGINYTGNKEIALVERRLTKHFFTF